MNSQWSAAALGLFLFCGFLFSGYLYETGALLSAGLLWIVAIVGLIATRRMLLGSFQLVIISFAAMYGLTLLYAADFEGALIEALKVSSVVPVVLICSLLSRSGYESMFRWYGWAAAMSVVWGIGFSLFRNNRLESTFGYANAYAIALLAALLLTAFAYAKERKSIYLFLIAFHACGLQLAMSRSVWLLWIASAALMLWVVSKDRKVQWKLGLAQAAGYVIAAAAKQDVLFFLQRATTIDPDASELQIRLVYWKDCLPMIRDFIVGGSGGGGWSMLLPHYRSQDYYVKYVHNHYLQILLDTGLPGFILFSAILGIFATAVWKSRKLFGNKNGNLLKGVTLTSGVLLLHAMFDFDLEYPLLLGLLIILMSYTVVQGEDDVFGGRFQVCPVAAVPIMFVPLISSLWLFAGYGQKEIGLAHMRHANPDAAIEAFGNAERIVPWSHTLHYESAKALTMIGNQKRDAVFYRAAENEMQVALRLAPEQELYRSFTIKLSSAAH